MVSTHARGRDGHGGYPGQPCASASPHPLRLLGQQAATTRKVVELVPFDEGVAGTDVWLGDEQLPGRSLGGCPAAAAALFAGMEAPLQAAIAAHDVDRQLELEMSSSGVEQVEAQRVLAEVQNEHASNMYGFSRKAWSKDPFYGWRTQGGLPGKQAPPRSAPPPTQAASMVPPSSQTRQREQRQALPSAPAPRSRMFAPNSNSMRPARPATSASGAPDPFAAWRSGTSGDAYVDSITAARQLAATHAADPFGAWRNQMPEAEVGSGAPPRSAARNAMRKGEDPFGTWRPQMQQTLPPPAPSTRRAVPQVPQQAVSQHSLIAPPTQRAVSQKTAGGPCAQQRDPSQGAGVVEPAPQNPTSVPMLVATLRGAIETLAQEGWNPFVFGEGGGSAGAQDVVAEVPGRTGDKASKFGVFC